MRVRLAALSALVVLALPPVASAWTWPVDGPVLRPFSFGSDPYAAGQHRGIDIGAPSGTPVLAAAGGVVSFAGTVPNGGKTVTIQTSTGYAVTLVHLGSIRVLRGTTVDEGAAVGTVGPSGVPDVAEPYVYLGIRVASDDQGYVDPLLFLPPRSAPPASPESASDPPSEPAGEGSVGGAPAPPVGVEPPSEPAADASGAPAAGEAASPAGEAADAGTGEASSGAGEEPGTTQEPAGTSTPDAGGAEQPAVPVPAGEEEVAPPEVATEPQADDVSSGSATTAPVQEPEGGRAAVASASPAQPLGGRSRAGAPAPVDVSSSEIAAAPTAGVVTVEHHATPGWVTQKRQTQIAAATKPPSEGDVVQDSQRALVRDRRPDRADPTATNSAHVAGHMSLRADVWIVAALAAVLAAALLLRRRRRRPGVTPAGAEAPRMMVLVGGSGHAVDTRGVDRQPREVGPAKAPDLDQHERLAA